MKRILFPLLLLVLVVDLPRKSLHAQSVQLVEEPGFLEYATYYISSFDLQTGASNVQLFRFRLESTNYPIYSKIWFKVSMISPALGINSETTIVELETIPFEMKADILLDNRDLSSTTTQLMDIQGNSIPLGVVINEMIEVSKFDQLLSSVITTGRLSDGIYTFAIRVYSGGSNTDISISDSKEISISVDSPSYLSLESPGGILADTSLTEIYSTYPLFIWYPQICTQCETGIRVAEFKRNVHASVDEAIEDETMLPFNQNEEWESLGNVSSFQYPISNARILEHNKVYVWQVKVSLPTTAGVETIISPVFSFKIGDIGGSTSIPSTVNPVIQILSQAMAPDNYNSLFGSGGQLDGFSPTGKMKVNGESSEESDIMYLLNQVVNQHATIVNISVND